MSNAAKQSKYYSVLVVGLLIVLCALMLFSFLVGSYPVQPGTVLQALKDKLIPSSNPIDTTLHKIIFDIRTPRIVLAVLTGGSLAVSGASYQTLFRNPMVSPDLLGVSAGAGFGAAFAMLQNASWAEVQISALLFGLLAVLLVYGISSVYGLKEITTFVLAGVIVSSLFQALLSVVKTYADTDSQLPSITFWLMGSLGKGDAKDVTLMLPVVAACSLILFLFRHQIDALAAGDEDAQSMGINVKFVRGIVIVCSTLMTVVSVSICGTIGWVGLVIPHIARIFTGARYNRLIQISFLLGAVFLLLMDNLIRGAGRVELPLGVLTSLVGTPVFAVLLIRSKRGWR